MNDTRPAWASVLVATVLVATALAGAAASLAPAPARADLAVVDSLEWSLASADAVHDGEVGSWERLGGGPDFLLAVVTPHPVGRVTPLVVHAPETLLRTASPETTLRRGERVIVFGELSEDGHRLELRRIFRAGDDRALLRDGSEIVGLDALGERVRGADGKRWSPRAILLPLETTTGDTASLRVPADRETELMLRARLADPHVGRRAMAAAALAPFESSANIARLLALLEDAASLPGSDTPVVCVWAARTLRLWEVPFPADACGGAPIVAEPTPAAPAPGDRDPPEPAGAAAPSGAGAPDTGPPGWPPWGW